MHRALGLSAAGAQKSHEREGNRLPLQFKVCQSVHSVLFTYFLAYGRYRHSGERLYFHPFKILSYPLPPANIFPSHEAIRRGPNHSTARSRLP